MRNSGCFPLGKASYSLANKPTIHAGCFSVSTIHRTPNMNSSIFNVRIHITTYDCTRRCRDTVRESSLKVDFRRKKNPCRTGESNLRQRRAGPMLYLRSYIPSIPSLFKCQYRPDDLTYEGGRRALTLSLLLFQRCSADFDLHG